MGHKNNPIGFRLGINRTWDSRWFADSDYAKLLHEDLKLRDALRNRLKGAGVSRVVIERPAKKPRVTIHAARPGVVIGKKGADIENLRKEMGKLAGAEVPLHTLRADIDFGVSTAKTTYGTCGVKVWVFKGEILAQDPMAQDKRAAEQAPQR